MPVLLLMAALLLAGCHSETVVQAPAAEDGTATASLSSYLYRPTRRGPFPAVVLLHGCAGILPKHKQWGDRLADWGYVALLVDSFAPRGVERICEADDGQWQRFNTLRVADARSAARYLRELDLVDANRVGVIGWSNGGTIVLDLSMQQNDSPSTGFRSAVAFYPSCWQVLQENGEQRLPEVRTPLMIAMGERDDWTHPEYCREWIEASDNQSRVELKLYPGAYHDFDNSRQPLATLTGVRVEGDGNGYGEVTVGFDQAADRQAQEDLRDFLGRTL